MRYFYRNHPGMKHPFYDKTSEALWHDKDFAEFKKVFDDEIQQIKDLLSTGKYTKLVSPAGDGIFSKHTDLSESRTPKIHAYMI